MFAFSSKFMLSEFRSHALELINPLLKLRAPHESSFGSLKNLRILENWDGLEAAYSCVPSVSFDYAIAEKCLQTVLVKAAFQWIDVGCWDEYVRLFKEDLVPLSEVYRWASESSFVDSDIPVALVNAEDLIVVIRSGKDNSPSAALIVKKGETQKVQEIVKKIKAAGRTDLL